MRSALTALFLCLAILFGIVESASGKAITGPQNPYPEQKLVKIGEVTEEFESVGRIPHREISIWFYDPATGVVFYVNQNPWTFFDPEGLSMWTMAAKFALKGGDIGMTTAGLVSDFNAFKDSRTFGEAFVPAMSMLSEVLPVSGRDIKGGYDLAKKGLGLGQDAKSVKSAGEATPKPAGTPDPLPAGGGGTPPNGGKGGDGNGGAGGGGDPSDGPGPSGDAPSNGASLATNRVNLQKQLASQEQLGQLSTCHRSNQNPPPMVESKPATRGVGFLRQSCDFFHLFCFRIGA